MKRFLSSLTYANVMATIALFVALGGASYAATQLPKNSVGSKQIKNNAITTTKIKNGAVTGAKIKTSSLGAVPSATHATNADRATNADSATNAASLGGVAASRYVTATSVLQSGQTETGVFGASTGSSGGFVEAVINFIPKAPAPLNAEHTIYVTEAAGTATHCPGVGKANPGYLCAYGTAEQSVSFVGFYLPSGSENGATADGTTLYLTPTSTSGYVRGLWAYTAP